jgi:Ca2+-binding RTX toxin-like protein
MATFVVTNLNDSGAGSLRQAILDANALVGADLITFTPLLNDQTITLTNGQLQITDDVTIDADLDGDTLPDITVDANQLSRVFNIDDEDISSNQAVVLDGLTITGGRTTGENEGGGGVRNRENLTIQNSVVTGNSTEGKNSGGGGIYSLGEYYGPFSNLTLINSTISGNTASGENNRGGGIDVKYGNLTVRNSQIVENSAQLFGGGIATTGAYFGDDSFVTVDNSIISGNSAKEGGGIESAVSQVSINETTITNNSALGSGGGLRLTLTGTEINASTISDNSADRGGGLSNSYSALTNVTNSTISGNSAVSGAGLQNGSYSGLTVSNSTISDNSATDSGGGILNNEDTGLRIRNSTITQNSAPEGRGSGVAQNFIGSGGFETIEVASSIIADNFNSDVDLVDGNNQSFISEGNNLIGTGNAASAFNQGSDITGVTDPGLEALADNGGLTLTHALTSDSPAINAGSNPDSLATDQRGDGFPRVIDGQADIGAFEFSVNPFIVTNLNDSGLGSLRQAILDANNRSGLDMITFDSKLLNQSINLTSGQLLITDGVTIDGDLNDDGFADITVDANQQSRVFDIDDGDSSANRAVVLDGLTITGGRTTGENEGGGGVRNREDLTIQNSVITGNSTTSKNSDGGGIYSLGEYYGPFSNLTLINSTISGNATSGEGSDGGGIAAKYSHATVRNSHILDNSAQRSGGGISTFGAYSGDDSVLTINDSIISNNSASRGGGINGSISQISINDTTIKDNSALSGGNDSAFVSGGGGIRLIFSETEINASTISGNSTDALGGGVSNVYSTFTTITNSTVSGNSAIEGAGILNNGYSGLTVSNSTISENSATESGGGIFNEEDAGLTIRNSTITRNSASEGQGSGIAQDFYSSGGFETIDVASSIIAGNTNSDVDWIGSDNQAFRSGGNNLIGTGSAASAFDQVGDITGVTDPGLEALADNGGPTLTHALKSDSPAINAGSNPDSLATDQRGDGFERVRGGRADIGAFELQNPPTVSNTFFFSADGDRTIDNLRVEDEDIIFFNGTDFSIFFDGSNVLPRQAEIDAFDVINETTILMSFNNSLLNVSGIGRVNDSDIVKFTAKSLGKGKTSGRFELYVDGSDLGFTRDSEDIDALMQMPDGSLLISTEGDAKVASGSLRSKGEDLIRFEPTSLGRQTRGSLSLYFDGSDVGLTRSWAESLDAVAMNADQLVLSTKGSFSVSGLSGRDEDAFGFTPTSLGRQTSGVFGSDLLFDGSRFGFSGDLSGIDAGFADSNVIFGTAGDDELFGTAENETFNGLSGDDRIFPGFGDDVVFGGAGDDFIQDTGDSQGNPGQDRIFGEDGNDVVFGGGGSDIISGGSGNDFLRDDPSGNGGNDQINGDDGNDTVVGDDGEDILNGGLGNDTVFGGRDDDVLSGGEGADKFVFRNELTGNFSELGIDEIIDFEAAGDRIELSQGTFNRLTRGQLSASEFAVVNTDLSAEVNNALIVYSSGTGHLFYNENLAELGFGNGGLFADLTNSPQMTAEQFVIT